MVRSLWTAASGMIAQQNNVDTIANNLANVNTMGYKTEVAEFKSLLYQDINAKSTSANITTHCWMRQKPKVPLFITAHSIPSLTKMRRLSVPEQLRRMKS